MANQTYTSPAGQVTELDDVRFYNISEPDNFKPIDKLRDLMKKGNVENNDGVIDHVLSGVRTKYSVIAAVKDDKPIGYAICEIARKDGKNRGYFLVEMRCSGDDLKIYKNMADMALDDAKTKGVSVVRSETFKNTDEYRILMSCGFCDFSRTEECGSKEIVVGKKRSKNKKVQSQRQM